MLCDFLLTLFFERNVFVLDLLLERWSCLCSICLKARLIVIMVSIYVVNEKMKVVGRCLNLPIIKKVMEVEGTKLHHRDITIEYC